MIVTFVAKRYKLKYVWITRNILSVLYNLRKSGLNWHAIDIAQAKQWLSACTNAIENIYPVISKLNFIHSSFTVIVSQYRSNIEHRIHIVHNSSPIASFSQWWLRDWTFVRLTLPLNIKYNLTHNLKLYTIDKTS